MRYNSQARTEERRQSYELHKENERYAKGVKRIAAVVGGAGLITIGAGIAAHGNVQAIELPGDVATAAGVVVAANARKTQKDEAAKAVQSARTVSDIHLQDPTTTVESWVIKALPDNEGDHLLQRLQQPSGEAQPPQAPPVNMVKH